MKRIFGVLTVVLIGMSQSTLAQWNTNGTHIYSTNTGNVGIGTNSPAGAWGEKLHVFSTSNTGLRIERGSGAFGSFLAYSDQVLLGSGSNHPLHLMTGGTAHLTIGATGTVGIGTQNPSPSWGEKLHIFSNTNTGLKIERGSGAFGSFLAYTDQVLMGSGSNHPLHLMTGGTTRLAIETNGNVGIGTVEPQSKLHISTANSMVLRFERPSSEVFGFEMSGTISGFYNYSTSKWVWRTNNGNMLMAETSGNVGIGTNAPDTKLTVKGTIHTEEVQVDLNGALAPDYVFDESYDLLSLDQVQDYINTHNHLPEVPSAAEMEENGLNLKEMNLLLLKKVEELTLYVIELKKENEIMKSDLNALKTR